ncbi:MAG: hypothetical protein ACFFEV_04280, partial [Candidatus Thorarchaeota archaeon]
VADTFYHTIRAVFEDAGNWFLDDPTKFTSSNSPTKDFHRALDRMVYAIQQLSDEELSSGFTFQWGERTTVADAIRQSLFHTLGHLSQIRNWVGVFRRLE